MVIPALELVGVNVEVLKHTGSISEQREINSLKSTINQQKIHISILQEREQHQKEIIQQQKEQLATTQTTSTQQEKDIQELQQQIVALEHLLLDNRAPTAACYSLVAHLKEIKKKNKYTPAFLEVCEGTKEREECKSVKCTYSPHHRNITIGSVITTSARTELKR